MQEREMVLDVLSGTKASISNYAKVIAECNNVNLRQTFQQMRDSDEQFQLQLYQVAAQKGYYHPAPPAPSQDMSSIRTTLSETMPSMS